MSNQAKRSITIEDVAHLDGISRAAVSKVIRDAVGGRLEATNPSDRDTTHVAQVYAVLAPEAKALGGVVRMALPIGETVRREARIGPDAFARWDDTAGRRVPRPGTHSLRVGTSSAGPATGIFCANSRRTNN